MLKFTFVFLLIGSAATEQLIFLTAVERLGMTTHVDYYFCCNFVGRFVHWEYNNQPLSGFLTNEVGEVRLDERANYSYAATLLSSQPRSNNEAEMDSVIVISFPNGRNPDNFTVTCSSNTVISTAFTKYMSTVKNMAEKADVRLDYVLSRNIVRRGPQYLSHIFICRVRQAPQFLEATELTLSFSTSDNDRRARTFFSDDRHTAKVQGILMARDNLKSVALIIVSLEARVVNVTCYDRENIVELPSIISSDNQVVTVDGTRELPADDTTESVQATEIPQTI